LCVINTHFRHKHRKNYDLFFVTEHRLLVFYRVFFSLLRYRCIVYNIGGTHVALVARDRRYFFLSLNSFTFPPPRFFLIFSCYNCKRNRKCANLLEKNKTQRCEYISIDRNDYCNVLKRIEKQCIHVITHTHTHTRVPRF